MDPLGSKIPAVVAAKRGENPLRRKGQGSSSTVVGRGLAGPKAAPNWTPPKGKRVNIPVPWGYDSGNASPAPDASG